LGTTLPLTTLIYPNCLEAIQEKDGY
jgi:hypothetical protein